MKVISTTRRGLLFSAMISAAYVLCAQTYPEPEFSNEVYFLKKDGAYSLVRLEKSSAKQEQKTSMIKGSEFGYEFEGKSSPVRFGSGSNLSFIFTNGSSSTTSNGKSDSAMRANGMDPNMFSGIGSSDPASSITLYKVSTDGDSRKIYLQKTGGALPFSSHKVQTSDKYTFSLKKIHDGYWVLIVDKTLPKGEYAFSMMGGMGGGDMMGSHTVFAFGID